MIHAAYEIERLLKYATRNQMIDALDTVAARNSLLEIFQIDEPYMGTVADEEPEYPTEILDALMAYATDQGLYSMDAEVYRELFDTKVMGLLLPRASEVSKRFAWLAENESVRAATDYFYKLAMNSNYIRTAQINRNITWETETEYGSFEITVNLSKPEKDPKQIALEKAQPAKQYPKCLLCLENMGYSGRINFPARQTLRVVPVILGNEQWYLQYSPYVYYNEHCIVFSEEHRPMVISRNAFEKLLYFVEKFPHYICGSNADLPIVGGSILTHDHFQGGRHTFPMMKAKTILQARHPEFQDVSIQTLKWPLSVIRASSESIDSLVNFSSFVLDQWRGYSDESVEILAFSQHGEEKTPHNTITPIAKVSEDGKYQMDLVLRNNRTNRTYPDGIFHPHKEIHHIKKENIGLIEVMGLAILPGRLKTEKQKMKEILTGKIRPLAIEDESDILFKHRDWIEELRSKYGTALSDTAADKVLNEEIGYKFMTCLEHCGTFKLDQTGRQAFVKFLESIGCHGISFTNE